MWYPEWFDFERQAVDALRGAVDHFELQIVSLVTFGNPTAYYIYRKDLDEASYSLRVVQWNKYFDLEIFRNPLERIRYVGQILVPTIVQKEIAFPDQSGIQLLLSEFSALYIPQSAKGSWGLDGRTMEVAFFRKPLHTEARFVWWANAPEEWKSLENLTEKTILFFREQSQAKGWFYV